MCEQHGTLPEAGGMLDQDYQTVTRMDRLNNIYKAIKRFRAATGEKIHNLTDNDREILKGLLDMGISING